MLTSNINILIATLLGLLIGHFLNVIIHRLPIKMQEGWLNDCADFLQINLTEPPYSELIEPLESANGCPYCKHTAQINFYSRMIRYVQSRGRCQSCHQTHFVRAPFIELLTAVCSAVVVYHFGETAQAIAALLLTWALIVLCFIDIDQQLLPDNITLPLLWLGLLLSLFDLFTDSHSSLIGAAIGYGALWTVYQAFKLVTGREGMGYGDFKLLAAFGAWLGWQYLPAIILLSSLVGLLVGVFLMVFKKHARHEPLPFGPYLACAGWLVLMCGGDVLMLI